MGKFLDIFLEQRMDSSDGAFIGGTITSEQKADKQPLSKISAILKKRAKRLKLIDKEMTHAVAQKIDEAVAKM